MSSPDELVRELCAAINQKDLDAVRSLLAENAVYHNIGMAPAVGLDASLEAVAAQFAMFERIEFRILNLATVVDTVLTERVDIVTANGIDAPIPVMGTFETEGGRITAWRDYFDMGLVGRLLSGESVPDLLPA
jgi:limonene-1,2-epoxide hydrolase